MKPNNSDIRAVSTKTLRKYASMLEAIATEVVEKSNAGPDEVRKGVREILDLCEVINKELTRRDQRQAEAFDHQCKLQIMRN